MAAAQIPIWIDGALERAVHPNPLKRYDSLSEFLVRSPQSQPQISDDTVHAADRAQPASVLEMHDAGAGAAGGPSAGLWRPPLPLGARLLVRRARRDRIEAALDEGVAGFR